MSEREVRADAKLQNLTDEDLLELWKWRNPQDADQKKMTYKEISVEVPLRWGFTVSLSTLSDFYKWLKLWKRTRDMRMREAQARRELLEQNPNASIEDLERLGQMILMSETVEDGDIKGFVALLKAKATNKKLNLEERRIKLLEDAAQKAEAAEEVTRNGKLSDAEKQAKLKQIFGIG